MNFKMYVIDVNKIKVNFIIIADIIKYELHLANFSSNTLYFNSLANLIYKDFIKYLQLH